MHAQLIRMQMNAGVAAGLTVLRAWSHGVTANYALQTSPGVYNEAMFRGLDYALDQAAQHNLKARCMHGFLRAGPGGSVL
jgi:mannan endo-1,4-beta-mannosidase